MAKKVFSHNEKLIINNVDLMEYYNTNIVPLNKNFRILTDSNPTTICPFHKDTDPSLRYWKKHKVLKCFGCGESANILRLHKLIELKYHSRELTDAQVIDELSKMYNISILEEDIHEYDNPFERARSVLKSTVNPNKLNIFSVNTFRTQNNRVIRANIPSDIRLANYTELDILTTAELVMMEDRV